MGRKNIRIPKRFSLFAHEITVEFSDTLMAEQSAYGTANFTRNVITLQNPKAVGATKEACLQWFYHELSHFILYFLNSELCTNETHVDNMGQLLAQYDVSRGYK